MTKPELLKILTGTKNPRFVNERETAIIDKCLVVINEKEEEIRNLNTQLEDQIQNS